MFVWFLISRLTAFVIKSYSQAREFIFVDDKHIKEGMSFLAKQQKDDGCFKATGRLLNNGMKVRQAPNHNSFVVSLCCFVVLQFFGAERYLYLVIFF